ncbi:MAG: RNA methyltransferase [Desulfatirhabdiaceae bacterium]
MKSFKPNLYLALIHYPVLNKHGEIIASAVTNLDIHDLARAARTYDVRAVYIVTPLTDQKRLVIQIVEHWTTGMGGVVNPDRKAAMKLISVQDSLESTQADIEAREKRRPVTLVTSARECSEFRTIEELKLQAKDDRPWLLLFGTAWGLADECMLQADHVLKPIYGVNGYNHLSVRSAASIFLDRLAGHP